MNAKFKEKALFVLEKLNDKKTTAVASAAAASSALMSAGVSAAESGGHKLPFPPSPTVSPLICLTALSHK